MNPYLTELDTAERRHRLMAEAAHERLVAQARHSAPTTLTRLVALVRRRWARPGIAEQTTCCAAA